MINDFLLIDKPANMTSFGVVARVRRVLSQSAGHKVKVGHTGTLDPFATGLMILVVGEGCKQASQFSKLDKVYQATIVLGQTSSTGDIEGDLTTVSGKAPLLSEVQTALASFVGEIRQTPPQFSAIKINGERAYKLARKGEHVAIPARTINIFQLELLNYNYPNLEIKAHVSSGTYIRTLTEDIGKTLKTGAYTSQLRRLRVGNYSASQAILLDDFIQQNKTSESTSQ